MKNNTDFKVGDVVFLNSNPEIRLTIKFIDHETNDVDCQYYNHAKSQFEFMSTSLALLSKVE